jgi:predicted ATPase
MFRRVPSGESISVTQVRACLQHLGDTSFLTGHPLWHLLGYDKQVALPGRNGLRDALVSAVEALRPTNQSLGSIRASWRYQAIALRYLEGQNVDALCDRLSVSQRELYRLLREGLEAVTEALIQGALADSGEVAASPPDASKEVTTFVGRRKELDRLMDDFHAVEQGQSGRALVMQGLPGVGKSWLIDEFGARIRERGGLYLKGHMFEDEREPYDAWIEALAPGLEALTAQQRHEIQWQAPEFFNLFLSNVPPVADSTRQENLADEAERQQKFYDGIVLFLDRLSNRTPVVLALDDLHWAPALSLFSYVVRRAPTLRLFVLATIRECQSLDRPRVYDEMQALVRGRHLSVMELSPLSRAEIGSLLAARLGGVVGDRLIDTIFDRTLGNPFFAEELIRAMRERGDFEQCSGEWDLAERATIVIPATVTAVIEERVSRLSVHVQEVLSTASALGERFHEGLLGLMLDLSQSEMINALEEALTFGFVIEEFVVGEESYRFTDPLVREVLYATIPGPKRRELHLRALAALERFYEDDLARHTQELARHYHLAGNLADGAAHAFRSGENAEFVFAWGTAIKWYEMALSLWDQAGAPPQRQAQVCLKLGKLYCQSSVDAAKGVSLLYRALATAQEVGDRQFTATVHLELARVQMTGYDLNQINLEEALSHLNAARATLEKLPMASGLARVYLGLYTLHSRLGEFDEGNAWVEKAKEASNELEDPEVIADSIVSAAAFLLISRGEVIKGREMFEEAWSIASRECLPASSDFCRQVAALIFGVSLKDPRMGLSWIRRQPDYGTRWLTLQSEVIAINTLLGQFESANTAFEELKVRLVEAGQPPFGIFPSDPGLFLARSGRWNEALTLLTEGLSWTKAHKHHLSSVRAASVRGGLLLEMGDLSGAEEDLQWAYDSARNNQSVMNIIRTAPALCELYVSQGRLAAAAVLLQEHQKLAEKLAPFGGAAADFWLAAARYHAAVGDWPRAEERFRAAAELNARFCLPWDEAQVVFKWALSIPAGQTGRKQLLGRAAHLWEGLSTSRYIELCSRELLAQTGD